LTNYKNYVNIRRGKKMSFVRKTISVDEKVWDGAHKLISEELNMSMSKFIEIQLRTIVRSYKGTFAQTMNGVIHDYFNNEKSLTEEQRRGMQSLFDKREKIKAVKKKK
jgi:hypothetical protein